MTPTPFLFKKSVFLKLLIGFVVFWFYKSVIVDRMGFCYKRLWFVSSEELILATIDDLMKSGRLKLDASDTSPQAYLANHPKCCNVSWGGGPFHRGLIYFGSASVVVSYEMKKEHMSEGDKKLFKKLYYDYYDDKTACGESVGFAGWTDKTAIEYRPMDYN